MQHNIGGKVGNHCRFKPLFPVEPTINKVNRRDDTRFAELPTRWERYLDSARMVCRYYVWSLPIRNEGVQILMGFTSYIR